MTDFLIIAIVVIVVLIALSFSLKTVRAFFAKLRGRLKRSAEDNRRVRIAFISQQNILLCPNVSCECDMQGLDVPFSITLECGEKVEHALGRLLAPIFGTQLPELRFCLKYKSEERGKLTENYLFMVYCEDGRLPEAMKGVYKLWTRRQIEENLGLGLFCDTFEREYPHLKLVIDTWSKFR